MKPSKGIDDVKRLEIIEEHLAGASMESVAKKYHLNGGREISRWMVNFGLKIGKPKEEATMKREQLPEDESAELKALRKENKALQLRVAKAELAERAWSKMIEIAEERFNIPIRKKYGPKR